MNITIPDPLTIAGIIAVLVLAGCGGVWIYVASIKKRRR